jgi:thiol-disulfide isomerase/thioredoxin
MNLETMEPNPVWDAESHADAVAVFTNLKPQLTIRVWGGDWCSDCRNQLPDFAAGLKAAGIAPRSVYQYPVEKTDDGSKIGPEVEEYDIELIPTVVVEIDGEEVARFVEEEPQPIFDFLADQLASIAPSQ